MRYQSFVLHIIIDTSDGKNVRDTECSDDTRVDSVAPIADVKSEKNKKKGWKRKKRVSKTEMIVL